jgi:hypothetical protein
VHGRSGGREGEREQVAHAQGGGHCEKVLELVPASFLHLPPQSAHIESTRSSRAHLEATRRVRLHEFADVADELVEGRPDLTMADNKGLGGILICLWSRRGNAALEMSPVLASPTHWYKLRLRKRWRSKRAEEEILFWRASQSLSDSARSNSSPSSMLPFTIFSSLSSPSGCPIMVATSLHAFPSRYLGAASECDVLQPNWHYISSSDM